VTLGLDLSFLEILTLTLQLRTPFSSGELTTFVQFIRPHLETSHLVRFLICSRRRRSSRLYFTSTQDLLEDFTYQNALKVCVKRLRSTVMAK